MKKIINGIKFEVEGVRVGFQCSGCGKIHYTGIKYASNNTYNFMCEDCFKAVMLDSKKSSNGVNSKLKKNMLSIHSIITLYNSDAIHSLKAIDNGYNVMTVRGRKVIEGECLGWSSVVALMRELKKVDATFEAVYNVEDVKSGEVAYNVPDAHRDLFIRSKWTVARYNREYGAR